MIAVAPEEVGAIEHCAVPPRPVSLHLGSPGEVKALNVTLGSSCETPATAYLVRTLNAAVWSPQLEANTINAIIDTITTIFFVMDVPSLFHPKKIEALVSLVLKVANAHC